MPKTEPRLLNVEKAASYLGVNPSTIRQWAYRNKLNGLKIGTRGDWRFTKNELSRMIQTAPQQKEKEKYVKIKKFLLDNANGIQKTATQQHKDFLVAGSMRSEFIDKYQHNHISIIRQFAHNLSSSNFKKGTELFKKLAQALAHDSIKDGLTLEEAVDGTIFVKQAVWEKLNEKGLLDELTTKEFYEVSQIIGTYTDVLASTIAFTYHELAEKELAYHAAIIESSEDAIYSKDLKGIITSWNKGAEKLFGYSSDEAIGKSVLFLVPPEQHHNENDILQKLSQGIEITHYETVRKRKDGSIIDVSISISPIKTSQGKLIGAANITRDITEKKQLERQKDDFISMASHELKTPITSAKMFIDILQKRAEKYKDAEIGKFITRLREQMNRQQILVSDLLDISRIETGKLQFSLEKFNLEQVLKDTIEAVQPITSKHTITFSSNKDLPVYADRFRVSQVFTNLLTNAIKYSPKGGDIAVNAKQADGMAIMSITDEGIGIGKKQQEKIFEKLYQVTEPQEKTFPGLGMGLYISKEIIERHNGKIWVESKKGKGSTFYFSLPLKK